MADNINKKFNIRFIVLSIVFILCFLISLFLGRYSINLTDFNDSLNIILKVRLPRILAAVLIGAALSVCGAVYQGIYKNPLAAPDILGVSSGSAFGAALGILLSFSYLLVSLSAFIFGLVAVLLTYYLSKLFKSDKILSLILSGILIGSLFTSLTSLLKLMADTDTKLPEITYWLMGSLSSVSINDIFYLAPIVIVFMIPLIMFSWRLNLLSSGDDEAKSMGVDVNKLRLIVIICTTIMTAACVSVSGIIGFVGIVIPHFCRKLFGYDYKRLIFSSILMGSSLLLITDDISRTLFSTEIPIGIITSFIGIPVFIILLIKKGKLNES